MVGRTLKSTRERAKRKLKIDMAKAIAIAKAAEAAKVELPPPAAAIVEAVVNKEFEEVHILLAPDVPIPPADDPLPVKVKRGWWAAFLGD